MPSPVVLITGDDVDDNAPVIADGSLHGSQNHSSQMG